MIYLTNKNNLTTMAASLVAFFMGSVFAQTASQLEGNFGNPPADYRLMVRYWWWGSNVTRSELTWELQQMKSQDILGVEQIGVYAAASGATVSLGSAQWASNVTVLIEEASKLGMFVWFTPATGWPWCYNGPGLNAKAASDTVLYQSTLITGPQTWTGQVPQPSGMNSDARLWQATLTRTATTGSVDPVFDTATVVTQNVNANNSATITVSSGQWILTGFWLQPAQYGGVTNGRQPDNLGPTVSFEDSGSVHMQLNWLVAPVLSNLQNAGESALIGSTLKGFNCDNLEVYTPGISWNFDKQFLTERQWNIVPYLPVRFYKSAQGDGARVTAEYNAVRAVCHSKYGFGGARQWAAKNGLTFRGQGHDWYYWADSYGNSDIPEFEQYGGALVSGGPNAGPLGRVSYGQKARAGADVYGRRIVSCETFTLLDGDGDTNNPSMKLMNQSLNNVLGAGANKILFHGYTYSPQDQSWFENFRASARFNHWHPFFPVFRGFADYIANYMYVLQQGKPVVDVLSLGPDTSIGYTSSEVKEDPVSEAGFLQNTFTVSGGTINTPMVSYKLLIVKDVIQNVETLRKLDTLIRAGAGVLFTNGTVAGTTPYYYGGQYAAINAEMAAIKGRIYDVITGAGPVAVGLGKVWSTKYDTPQAVLTNLNIKPDVIGPAGWQTVAGELPFQHRRGDDFDVYFLNNNSGASGNWQFRAVGNVEEWDAATGRISPLNFTGNGEYSTVYLGGAAYDSKLIVIRRDKAAISPRLDSLYYTNFQAVSGTWKVIFTNNLRKSVDTVNLATLTDWSSISGLSGSFVGIGDYAINFNVSSLPDPAKDVILDLGTMYDVAQVTINGVSAGYTWKAPYRVYATGLLKTGSNQLDIRVGSRWYKSGVGRGLLGPVTLQVASRAIPTGVGPFSSHNARNRLGFSIRPGAGGVKIFFSRKDDYTVEISDIRGRKLNEYAVNKASLFDSPRNACAPAVYLISVKRGGEVRRVKCVIVK
jgi:hypothetical protein